MLTMDWVESNPAPTRGDYLQFPKRCYVVLSVRLVKRRDPLAGPRYKVWAVSTVDISPNLVFLLEARNNRRGGANMFPCHWNPRKKKARSFEDLMRGK